MNYLDIDITKSEYFLRPEKEEEYLAALKKYGLFQLSEEGFKYFFMKGVKI